jgi:hypothetical protein
MDFRRMPVNAAAINPSNIASVDNPERRFFNPPSTAQDGANGVIIITTKSGKAGQAKVSVNMKTGFAKANKHDFYDVLDGAQYVQWLQRGKAQNNGTPIPLLGLPTGTEQAPTGRM